MDSPTIAPPLAGHVLGSHNDSFVVAKWRDAGAQACPPRWVAPENPTTTIFLGTEYSSSISLGIVSKPTSC
jgi:hypothetical protein